MIRVSALSLCLVLSAVTTSIQARLGDTEMECFRRYNSPVKSATRAIRDPLVPGAIELDYRFEGWRITVALMGGKVIAQRYAKSADHPNGNRINDDEWKTLLEAEAGGQEWTRLTLNPNSKDISSMIADLAFGFSGESWKRTDGTIANRSMMKVSGQFLTPAAQAILQRAKEDKANTPKKNIPKF